MNTEGDKGIAQSGFRVGVRHAYVREQYLYGAELEWRGEPLGPRHGKLSLASFQPSYLRLRRADQRSKLSLR